MCLVNISLELFEEILKFGKFIFSVLKNMCIRELGLTNILQIPET